MYMYIRSMKEEEKGNLDKQDIDKIYMYIYSYIIKGHLDAQPREL